MERAYDTDSILAYQYSTIFDQLLLLQLHAENENCPCSLREAKQEEIGEYCEPKHLRSILALARETIPMESEESRINYLKMLVMEGTPLLQRMMDKLCGKEINLDDYLGWIRSKRKELERFYYSSFCLIRPEQKAEQKGKEEKVAVNT